MNRSAISCANVPFRRITPGSKEHKEQVRAWTQRLLAKEPCVPDGHVFSWNRGTDEARNTAYLFDAVMCNVQYAQMQLQNASVCAGKQAYVAALEAAKTYAHVLTDLLPKWTFVPNEVYGIPDATVQDIYGHYCLARAMAYKSVGKADMKCNAGAKTASAGNAAHLYAVAAQLVVGDATSMIQSAEESVGDGLASCASRFLDEWDHDRDANGAAKALACYREAHMRYLRADLPGCQDKVDFAFGRNQVHWIEPELPDFISMIRARVTAL